MNKDTQYSKFYGKLIDLAAMKLTSSLWCFLDVILAHTHIYVDINFSIRRLTDNKPSEMKTRVE